MKHGVRSSSFLPLRLPGDEAEGGVKEQTHLCQDPLLVDSKEGVWGRGGLEGHVHRMSRPAQQNQSTTYRNEHSQSDSLQHRPG